MDLGILACGTAPALAVAASSARTATQPSESGDATVATRTTDARAFVGSGTWRGSGEWYDIEAAPIDSHGFEAARRRARAPLAHRFANPDRLGDDPRCPRPLKLNDRRARGVRPTE